MFAPEWLRLYSPIRDLLYVIWRLIRRIPSDPGPEQPAGSVRLLDFQAARKGFEVPFGWRGIITEGGEVQVALAPGRYRRRKFKRLSARRRLGDSARILIWREKDFSILLHFKDIFAQDQQQMELRVAANLRLLPERLMERPAEWIGFTSAAVEKRVSPAVRDSATDWVASFEGETPYREPGFVAREREKARAWLQSALSDLPFQATEIVEFRLFSPFLDKLYLDYGSLARQNARVRFLVEQNAVRGALRQSVLAGELQEMRDEDQFDYAVLVIQQDRSLREKVMRRELAQAELDELKNMIEIWQRKHQLLDQVLSTRAGDSQSPAQRAVQFTQGLLQAAVNSSSSPFSPQEKQQIRDFLLSNQARTATPEEIISAIAKGANIPPAIFDPLVRLCGRHTLRVGNTWRIFDGDSLWQVRLNRICMRRHGFLWLRESPSCCIFEVHGSPRDRNSQEEVRLGGRSRFQIGPHEISVEFTKGSASQASLLVG